MRTATAAQLVENIKQLVALPDACIRVNELIDDPQSSASDFADVISLDTDLSARLLGLANSAYFGLSGRVETISRAVTIIGTSELRDMAIATAACDLFEGVPADMFNMDDFWHYSVGTGIITRALARDVNILHPERLFVMGILHDMGRLVILQHLTSQARDILLIAQGKSSLLTHAEKEVLGYTHSEVGYELSRLWKLPESIQSVIRYHHDPELAHEYRMETMLTNIGQAMAHGLVWDKDADDVIDSIDPAAWAFTGLTVDRCRDVSAEVGQQVIELLSVLMGVSHRRRIPV